jgi:hypothetical protein
MVPRFGGDDVLSFILQHLGTIKVEVEYSKTMDINELATLVAATLMTKAGMGDASEYPEEWDLNNPNGQFFLHINAVQDIISLIDKLGYIKDLEPIQYDEPAE